MKFEDATDILIRQVTLGDLADEIGVARNTVLRARMEGEHARPKPSGWERAVARLARQRGTELLRLADELERVAGAEG